MCIILTCEAGIRPNKELIENCFATNPDGGGVMWADGGYVHTSKGYSDVESFIDCINAIPEDAPLVIHMRIATSGGIDVGTCHPFPISNDLDVLHAADTECLAAIAHNGVIHNIPTNDKLGISDTVGFVMDTIAPQWRGKTSRRLKKRIMDAAPGNRFAIMTSDGTVSRIGYGWETVSYGIQASNDTWRWGNYYSFGRKKFADFDAYDFDLDDPWGIDEYDAWGADDLYTIIAQEADALAVEDSKKCQACNYFGTCKAYGPSCEDVMGLSDLYFEDIAETYAEKHNKYAIV